MVEMDIVTKKQLNILIQLAEADKHFSKIEREMIFKIARERNFPEESVNDLIRNPEPIDSLGALSNDQKFEYLISAIEMIFVDQNVFESEVIFCKNIAIKLGFRKNVVEFIMNNYGKKSREEFRTIALREYL
jgi:CRISPR/Cas system CSM-associated protein Csm5 (group 7 of RAMP superfamily)